MRQLNKLFSAVDEHEKAEQSNTDQSIQRQILVTDTTHQDILARLRKKKENKRPQYNDFIGRERLMEKLFNWLSDKNKESGSYLVTGFRGMGKTVLLDRVVC